MNAMTLARIQTALHSIEKETDWQLVDNGIHYTAQFYIECNRSRNRFTLWADGVEIGIMDAVVPFSIFKTPYEVFMLHFSTTAPFNFPGITWEADPYHMEGTPLRYYPTTLDASAMADFHQKRIAA